MAWGYWSVTSVLPDRGRSPRRQSSLPAPTPAPVSIMSNQSAPGVSSEIGPENHNSVAESTTSEETEELPSRRPSLELPGPPLGRSVVLCAAGSRSDSLRKRYVPDDKDIIINQQECYVHSHQPLYTQCHIHSRERIRRTTDGLSDSEEESSDPGYASGIKMFTLCSDNDDDEESEPGYESGEHFIFTLVEFVI